MAMRAIVCLDKYKPMNNFFYFKGAGNAVLSPAAIKWSCQTNGLFVRLVYSAFFSSVYSIISVNQSFLTSKSVVEVALLVINC